MVNAFSARVEAKKNPKFELRMQSEATNSEPSQHDSATGLAGSASDTSLPSHLISEAEDPTTERPKSEAFEASDVDLPNPQLHHRRASFGGEAATDHQPRGAASKLRHPFAGLLFLLLALVAASSGFLLAERKRTSAFLHSSAGEEALGSPSSAEGPVLPSEVAPTAAAAEAEDGKQSEPDEAEAASRTEEDEEEAFFGAFEAMFVKAPGEAVLPLFLRGQREALEQFKVFVDNYKADLEGGEEKDEEAREKRRHWVFFKMQMATLANMEVLEYEQLGQLPMEKGYEEAVETVNNTLKKIYKLKVDMAALWMKLVADGGLHPDPTKDETMLSLLRAQEAHYERALNRLVGVGVTSTPKAANYIGDPRLEYRKSCGRLERGDQWLMYAMP
ncbi:hypothetical protein Emag_003118 [Eimeria magna]